MSFSPNCVTLFGPGHVVSRQAMAVESSLRVVHQAKNVEGLFPEVCVYLYER